MHWVPHATAGFQGTWVICSSKGIQWYWGMYLLRGQIKRLVVVWTGTLAKFRHSDHDFDRFNSYDGHLELQLSVSLTVQTGPTIQIVPATSTNRQYISVWETWTWRLDQSLPILQTSSLPFFPFLWNITLKNKEKKSREGKTNPHSRGFREYYRAYLWSSRCAFQHWNAFAPCGQSDVAL